jgi:hypothetical protein
MIYFSVIKESLWQGLGLSNSWSPSMWNRVVTILAEWTNEQDDSTKDRGNTQNFPFWNSNSNIYK